MPSTSAVSIASTISFSLTTNKSKRNENETAVVSTGEGGGLEVGLAVGSEVGALVANFVGGDVGVPVPGDAVGASVDAPGRFPMIPKH